MTEIITLKKKITMGSEYLDQNIWANIKLNLENCIKDECSQEYGYFLNVIGLNRIIDNYISSNCENIFIIEFNAEILKPVIGKKYEGNVCMIFCGGILINVKDKLKILIPLLNLENYEIKENNSNMFICVNKKDSTEIKENDLLIIEILGTKYTKQNFSCYGKLIEKVV